MNEFNNNFQMHARVLIELAKGTKPEVIDNPDHFLSGTYSMSKYYVLPILDKIIGLYDANQALMDKLAKLIDESNITRDRILARNHKGADYSHYEKLGNDISISLAELDGVLQAADIDTSDWNR